MNTPIDIIVTWVDYSLTKWQEDFNNYRSQEIANEQQDSANIQAFGLERYRDWNVFNYWFRAVEMNCPWVRKVFLVVADETHIPKWLNTNNPKLRIVYHKEFIPNELLPTFNSSLIEFFFYRIEDLSDIFITSNDDMYFLQPIPKNFFVDGGKIVKDIRMRAPKLIENPNFWQKRLNNNIAFLMKHKYKCYHQSHLPEARLKSFEIDFMNKHYMEIYDAMSVSRFRHPNNFISWLLIDLLKNTGNCINKNIYSNSCAINLIFPAQVKLLKDKIMCCINDSQELKNFTQAKKEVQNFLNARFPNKSSFEK